MTTTKPTILLIPGAWHTPAHYSALLDELEKNSYPTISHKLPSVDCIDASKHTAQTDADFIRTQLLLPTLEEGKRVIVAMHSYGGLPGSAAAYGLSEEERRKEGLKGGVIGLVYIAAFIIPSGTTVSDTNPPPLSGLTIAEDGLSIFHPASAQENFHKTLPPTHHHLAPPLSPTAISVLSTPVSASAHETPAFKNLMAYIHCTKDKAIDFPLQQRMVASAGVGKVATLEADHCPFFTMPVETAGVVMGMVGGFE